MPTEETQKGGVRTSKEKEAFGVRNSELEELEPGRHAAQRQHYAELDFADERPIPPPPSDMFVVAYTEVGQA